MLCMHHYRAPSPTFPLPFPTLPLSPSPPKGGKREGYGGGGRCEAGGRVEVEGKEEETREAGRGERGREGGRVKL